MNLPFTTPVWVKPHIPIYKCPPPSPSYPLTLSFPVIPHHFPPPLPPPSLPFSPQRYGDSFPRKPPAKIVAAAWMVLSSFVLCNVIASQCLNGYDMESASNRAYSTLADVNGQRIAVPASTLMEFLLLRRTSGATSAYKNCEAAFDAVVEGEEALSTLMYTCIWLYMVVYDCIWLYVCMVDLILGLLSPMGSCVCRVSSGV